MTEQIKQFIRGLRKRFWAAAATAGAVAALALVFAPPPASAQPQGDGAGQSLNFLADGILSLTVSNGIPFTNTLSVGVNTNIAGLSWTNVGGAGATTNTSGSNIVAGSSITNSIFGSNVVSFTTTKLTRDVPLWSEQTGYSPTNCNISCTFIAGAGNTTTNAIVFSPLYDGENETTTTGDYFAWNFFANGATVQTISTNGILQRWPGARRLRVHAIISGTNAAASSFTVIRLRLNGFPR